MEETVKVPELCRILYGDGAELAWATAGEQVRRWANAFDAWLAEETRRTSPKRSRDLHYAWIGFWDCCQKLPWEATETDIRAWVGQLQAGRRAGDTIRKKLYALDSFYRYCDTHQVDPGSGPPFNPARPIRRPSEKKLGRLDYLNLEETRALLVAVDREETVVGKRDYALILTALRTGREIGEIRAMKWGVPGFTWQVPRKDVEEAIEEYLQAAGRWEGMQTGEYIFVPVADSLNPVTEGRAEDWNGTKPLSTAQARFMLKRYACWAGLDPDRVTWTCLRYTAGVIRLEMGDELEEVAAFLGVKSTVALERNFRKLGRGAAEWRPRYPAETLEIMKNNLPRPEGGAKKRSLPRRERYARKRGKPKAQPGNTLSLKHGLYSKKKPEEILAALLAEQKMRGGEVVGLKAETLGLRILMGQLFGQALEKVETIDELLKVLDQFGKAGVRLATLLKTEKELYGGQSELEKVISQALSEVVEELRMGGEANAEMG